MCVHECVVCTGACVCVHARVWHESVGICVCAWVRVAWVCGYVFTLVCVCVCMRERESERVCFAPSPK